MGKPIPVDAGVRGRPLGNDGIEKARTFNSDGEIENEAQEGAEFPEGVADADHSEPEIDFLHIVSEAQQQALLYVAQSNRKAWSQSLRAFHNEHYVGSKYTRPDWRGRSKLFVPKTRAAVRKDNAAVAASLFNNIDAISCLPGNEGDPMQRGAAAVMQELVNYRTDRASGKASFPWFLVSMGSRQDATLTGVCLTKQFWHQEHRKVSEDKVLVEDEDGVSVEQSQDVYELDLDRPEMALIPPENYVIDPGADWTNPAQKSAFLIIKWPMTLEEIKAKQNSPVNPWKEIDESLLKQASESGKYDMAAIRRARELGLDRLDETQTGTHFQIIWVYENFVRVKGDDYTFYSIGDQAYVTDPKPVREVYPAHFGERPLALGYGNLESHRIYPMSPVESWQPLQLETNDIRNLMLDATKQNVMPISKVRRGRQIDLDQVRRRSSGSSIIVNEPDDVTWEQAPTFPQQTVEMQRELDLEMDDLAGQQNYGSVETNNALGKTLGGLKLAAGAANAVQEFDIRVWLETWASPALTQIVQLEQYYESDPVVLGLVGERAKLFQKYGIDQITDELLEQSITVRVSAGLGAGDPMQRLAKFEKAAEILAPIVQMSPEFQSGKREINIEAMIQEVFGAAGYKDGGSRFFKENQNARPNPMMDLQTAELQAKIEKDKKTGQAAWFTGIANLAKVALGKRELESQVVDQILSHQMDARQLGFDHAHQHMTQHLAATDHGHRHGMAILEHKRNLANDAAQQAQQAAETAAGGGGDNGGGGGPPVSMSPAEEPRPQQPGPMGGPQATPPQGAPGGPPPGQGGAPSGPQGGPQMGSAPDFMSMLQNGGIKFSRGPDGRINGIQPGQPQASTTPKPQDSPELKMRQAAQTQQPVEEVKTNANDERLAKLEEALSAVTASHADLLKQNKSHANALATQAKSHTDALTNQAKSHAEALAQARAEASRPRKRKVVRDDNNRITHIVEDVA